MSATVTQLSVLRHSEEVPPGYLARVLDEAGVDWREVRLDLGRELPDAGEVDAVVSLGGVMGAYDEETFPFLAAEKEFLRRCVAAGVPVLGICLGCQLLADALGGEAYLAPVAEVAFAEVRRTAAGAADPVVGALHRPALMWHQDTWDLPPDATLLATSDRYPQAFRLGSALGLQPHPEASPELATLWAESDHGRRQLGTLGIDAAGFLSRIRAARSDIEAQATAVFAAWLEQAGLTASTKAS